MQKYEEELKSQLNKFLRVYFIECGSEIENDLIISFDYTKLVKIIGNYIFTVFKKETWTDTFLDFKDLYNNSYNISFKIFKNNKYRENVEKFLILLQEAFVYTGQENVYNFINEKVEDPKDKEFLTDYYNELLRHQKVVKEECFTSESKGLLSEKSKESKKHFIDYISENIANDEEKVKKLERFLEDLKIISMNEDKIKIFFDDNI